MKLKEPKHYVTIDPKYVDKECHVDGWDGFFRIVGFGNNTVFLTTRYKHKVKYEVAIDKVWLTRKSAEYIK